MATISIINRPDVTPYTFVQDALKRLRWSRARAAQRRHLLSLDDKLLRDMGLTRLDVLNGDF